MIHHVLRIMFNFSDFRCFMGHPNLNGVKYYSFLFSFNKVCTLCQKLYTSFNHFYIPNKTFSIQLPRPFNISFPLFIISYCELQVLKLSSKCSWQSERLVFFGDSAINCNWTLFRQEVRHLISRTLMVQDFTLTMPEI